jgi:ubiquinone/menaquinone biosynthesis C-methylase UbiE
MTNRQTEYYNQTAKRYDEMHGGERDFDHVRALEYTWPILENFGIQSVLEIGCGTGRSLQWIHAHSPAAKLSGVELASELLSVAKSKLPDAELRLENAESMSFPDASHDLVLATGVMHHADHPRDVIREMFRVARKAVLISDHNVFAVGGKLKRWLRLWLFANGVLGPATFIKQGFRKQGYSEDDGWWYAYSLLNDFGLIGKLSARQYIIPTRPVYNTEPGNFLLAQTHMAILAFKDAAFASSSG